jgi:glycerol dehydrogenase-like iron-containing ADH family enzyme
LNTTSGLSTVSLIAPHRLLRGRGASKHLGEWTKRFGSRPFVVSGKGTLGRVQGSLAELLGPEAIFADYGIDCTETAVDHLVAGALRHDVVVGVGGGKALDAAKLVAHRAGLPVITLPTSAATCAAWAALSNVYSKSGTWLYGVELPDTPQAVIVDYELIAAAPRRLLVSGMGDALAKWYESSVSSSESADPLVMAAVQQARVLRDLILLRGEEALSDPTSAAFEQMIDASVCLAGFVGGLGGARCRTVAAHAVHNALTAMPGTRRTLHGEKVAFGILVQLRLEETVGGNRLAAIAREQLESFYRKIGLPCTLADLHFGELSGEQLRQVAELCCAPGSDIHHLPFAVTSEVVLRALTAESLVAR